MLMVVLMGNYKVRVFLDKNYKAFYFNGKTIRLAVDPSKPILDLDYPEFYDVKITDKCFGGCQYCYMDSTKKGEHCSSSTEDIKKFFGGMSHNERPFQVAIGGGEPTLHPNFIEILQTFYALGITPNYTTNGMFVKEDNLQDILEATKQYCGGVAVSCHPHLTKFWEEASHRFASLGVKLNFHCIISDRESIDDFNMVFAKWEQFIDYFVLLPYGVQGRAKEKDIDWEYLIKNVPNHPKLAFGANFHKYLCETPGQYDVSLYEPESMSQFIDLCTQKVYPSSFDLIPLRTL